MTILVLSVISNWHFVAKDFVTPQGACLGSLPVSRLAVGSRIVHRSYGEVGGSVFTICWFRQCPIDDIRS